MSNSNYQAHLLYSPASPPQPLPRLARPKTHLGFSKTAHHGFVFCSEAVLTVDRQYQLRSLAEVFSDDVIPIQEGLFYGSLAYTWNYFASRDSLRRHVEKQKLANTAVVVGEHLFRSFVYLLIDGQREGFQFVCNEDLLYRRFLQRLTWDEWARGAAHFYEIITLDKESGFKEELAQFIHVLKQLRFKSPGQVALDCTHLPTALMERFGSRCSWLWKAWIANDSEMEWPRFKEHVAALNPTHFATAVFETAEFTDHYTLYTQEFLEAIRVCLTLCLKKISKFNTSHCFYGIQDFKINFTLQSVRQVERTVHLAVPLYEWSKTAATIVELASTHLLDAVEEDREDGIKRVYHLTHISDLVLTPLQLSIKQHHPNGLFGEVDDSQILEVRDTLRAFDSSTIELYRVQPELAIKQSFTTLEKSWQLPGEQPTAATWLRPICILKSPKKISVRQLKSMNGEVQFFRTEIIEPWYYYIAVFKNHFNEDTFSLWLAFLSQDKLSIESSGFLLGFFDADFKLPKDIADVQRCAYV